MIVATRKKEAPPMPSWVMTEPELGPELTYAFCGCQHPRDCGYSYATDITGRANLWFLSWSPLFAFPACATEPAPLLLMDWQVSAIHTVRQLQMCPCGLHLATRPVLVGFQDSGCVRSHTRE